MKVEKSSREKLQLILKLFGTLFQMLIYYFSYLKVYINWKVIKLKIKKAEAQIRLRFYLFLL